MTAIIDGGKEPSGVASGVKECFLYDTRDRLIRAHTATITGTCATTTASTSSAAGTLAAYDTRWTFDDLGRTRTVRDMLAAATVTYNYTTSRHAITSLTGAATAAYTYNPVGAMTTRNTTALGYDAMQRLTSYGSIDTNLYRASNQRLIRTSGTTRTLYVPGMDVTVSAGVRTITRTLTIDGTPYGTRTLAGGATATMWNCTNPQHTLTCTTPAGSTSIPPRTRYSPYGTPRTTTTITNTDRGHLNQPHDPTGLTYLNNRYYDPTLNAFTSVDPLVGKTGTPYLYANGNPTTLSDPNGLEGRCADGSVYGGSRFTSTAQMSCALSEISQVKVKVQFPGATSPAAAPWNIVNGRPEGGWPVTPWVWQQAMSCVGHASPALQDGGCQVAGEPDTGTKVKPSLASCALFLDCPFEQLKECTLGGLGGSCQTIYANAAEAEAFAAGLEGPWTPTQRNAIQHAYWFALNRYDLNGLAGADIDGTLRTFGKDHEADWRDSYLDARKDEANNAIGVTVGAQAAGIGLSRDEIGVWLVANSNLLFCVSNVGDQAYGSPSNC